MSSKKDNLFTRVGYYPHYQAIKCNSDLMVMTNDGTFGETYARKIGYDSKILFLRNGVDVTPVDEESSANNIRKMFGIDDSDFVFMTVSRLANWKRIDRAISLIDQLSKQRDNVKLIVVGDGQERQNLEQLVDSLDLRDKVFFAGGVKQSDVPRYLAEANIFLSLYDIGNLGNPIFEAMKCQKTIVTLNNGDTASLMTNDYNCVMLDMEELPRLAIHVDALMNDKEKMEKLAQCAKECASKEFWSWTERMQFECAETEKLLHE